MIVDMVDPGPNTKLIDPACGSGGFLVEALRHVWKRVDEQGHSLGWPDHEIESEKHKVAIRNFYGIDKDAFLSKVAKAYMAILGDGRGGVHCENSLERPSEWGSDTQANIKFGTFDLVMTNPPFGKKLAIESEELLKRYDLGHKWSEGLDGDFEKGSLQDKQPPQILFIERCFDLLREGGTLGIVLLESIFGMPKYRYVVDYIRRKSKVKAIVTMPEDLFQPHTHAKCCILVCEKSEGGDSDSGAVFMADVKWCGHDSRGNPTYRVDEQRNRVLLDDVPIVAGLYAKGPGK